MRIAKETAGGGKNEALRIALTKRGIESLQPTKRRYYVYDVKQAGLTVSVFPSGVKSFVVYRKVRGRPVKITLGRFPGMTLETARKRTASILAEFASGEDPAAKIRAQRRGATLQTLWERYRDEQLVPHCRPQSVKLYTWQWDRTLSRWKNRQASSLTHEEIRAWHTKIGAETPAVANRLLSHLKSMLDHGKVDPNPCEGVPRFKENERERFLDADELKRLLAALDDDPSQTFRDFIHLALLTAVRQTNLREMRWDELDLEKGVWFIGRTKNGDSLRLPLPGAAVEILLRRKETATSDYVLPSRTGAAMCYPNLPWRALLERAGITNLRIHDLRRSNASWQAAGGTSLHIIGKSLGHRSSAATRIYARLDLDPVRESMERAAAAMFGKGGDQ